MHGLALTDVTLRSSGRSKGLPQLRAMHMCEERALCRPYPPPLVRVTTQLIDTGKFESLFANHKKS